MAVWLQVKVHDRGLGLRPRLFVGHVCDDNTTETAYPAVMKLCKWTLAIPFPPSINLGFINWLVGNCRGWFYAAAVDYCWPRVHCRVSLVRCFAAVSSHPVSRWRSRRVERNLTTMWSWRSCRKDMLSSSTTTRTLSSWSESLHFDIPLWSSWSLYPVSGSTALFFRIMSMSM